MDFFKSTLDLLKRDDNKLFKNTVSPASHKSSPNSSNGESNANMNTSLPTVNPVPPVTTTPNPPSSINGNNGLPIANGVPKNQPSTTTATNSINPPSPITSLNSSEQELWKLLEKQRQLRKRKPPVNAGTLPLSNVSNNPTVTPQNPQQIKPVSSNPSMKRKIGGGGLIQPVNVNNGPTVKNQQPPKKIKTDIR